MTSKKKIVWLGRSQKKSLEQLALVWITQFISILIVAMIRCTPLTKAAFLLLLFTYYPIRVMDFFQLILTMLKSSKSQQEDMYTCGITDLIQCMRFWFVRKAEDKLVFKKIAGSFQDVRFASWIIAENAWWFVLWNLFSLNIFMQKKTALVILELKFQRCWSKKYNKMMYRYLLICIDDKNDKCWFIQPGIMVNYLSNAENPFNIYLLKCC